MGERLTRIGSFTHFTLKALPMDSVSGSFRFLLLLLLKPELQAGEMNVSNRPSAFAKANQGVFQHRLRRIAIPTRNLLLRLLRLRNRPHLLKLLNLPISLNIEALSVSSKFPNLQLHPPYLHYVVFGVASYFIPLLRQTLRPYRRLERPHDEPKPIVHRIARNARNFQRRRIFLVNFLNYVAERRGRLLLARFSLRRRLLHLVLRQKQMLGLGDTELILAD